MTDKNRVLQCQSLDTVKKPLFAVFGFVVVCVYVCVCVCVCVCVSMHSFTVSRFMYILVHVCHHVRRVEVRDKLWGWFSCSSVWVPDVGLSCQLWQRVPVPWSPRLLG